MFLKEIVICWLFDNFKGMFFYCFILIDGMILNKEYIVYEIGFKRFVWYNELFGIVGWFVEVLLFYLVDVGGNLLLIFEVILV